MTPDKNFKMKKPYKTMIALTKGSKESRNQLKRMLIDAQLHEEAARKAALKSKEKEGGGRGRGAIAPE
jgi:hypothetical protein